MTSLQLDDLLTELRRRHWTLFRWGEANAPTLIAAVQQWDACADVLILRSEDDATAFRVPDAQGSNVLVPEKVSYQYHASALWTLRAILSLPTPDSTAAPTTIETPHAKCRVPEGLPRPIVIRPLSPHPK
ncbi:hypothetical protein HFP15_22315 [Amycolatopsis sp. K13G38]|uniref:Immunity protein 35 domain-containing protein n=1 Tax=Amycolatopsis acididurans TaxID=2724524 RepID=A0ABX1J749_9PSEU|nr:hypothetical protein [Amycolatopsis acididurans]NKQ55622.1 hypothetical protein [Amycolatopsis acididurans]